MLHKNTLGERANRCLVFDEQNRLRNPGCAVRARSALLASRRRSLLNYGLGCSDVE
jgi:hypothetical protein